jgi:hypothetical protein
LWPIALCGLGLPVFCLACLALASAAAKVSAAAWAASFACASWCPFLTRAAPGAKRRRSAAGQRLGRHLGIIVS